MTSSSVRFPLSTPSGSSSSILPFWRPVQAYGLAAIEAHSSNFYPLRTKMRGTCPIIRQAGLGVFFSFRGSALPLERPRRFLRTLQHHHARFKESMQRCPPLLRPTRFVAPELRCPRMTSFSSQGHLHAPQVRL